MSAVETKGLLVLLLGVTMKLPRTLWCCLTWRTGRCRWGWRWGRWRRKQGGRCPPSGWAARPAVSAAWTPCYPAFCFWQPPRRHDSSRSSDVRPLLWRCSLTPSWLQSPPSEIIHFSCQPAIPRQAPHAGQKTRHVKQRMMLLTKGWPHYCLFRVYSHFGIDFSWLPNLILEEERSRKFLKPIGWADVTVTSRRRWARPFLGGCTITSVGKKCMWMCV